MARMNFARIKYEGWLYGLAFLLAASLRLIQLGAAPLYDTEAQSALQALHVAQGLKPALGPHPAYILFTSVLFFIFGSSNFLARLIPALAGSALVLAPLLFRERLKPRASLILAFFLAIEPGLVALSRQAASSILAITFIVLALGYWFRGRPELAGAFSALALLGGPAIWPGMLGLAITWAIRQAMEARAEEKGQQTNDQRRTSASRKPTAEPPPSSLAKSPQGENRRSNTDLRPALPYFFGTLLLVGTLLYFAPNGLSAALASLADYFTGWGRASGIPVEGLLFSLLIYQPLGLILAAIAVVRGWRNASRRIMRLGLWFVIALLIAVLYPAHQMGHLAWALIPLWALAALELSRQVHILREERGEAAGVALLTFFFLGFVWIDLAGLAWVTFPSADATVRLSLMVGAVFLLAVSLFLVAAGWSGRIARFGSLWGLTLALGVYTLAGAAGAAGLRGDSSPEMWWLADRPAQAQLLAATVADLSEWGTGDASALPIMIAGVDSPALEWILRSHTVTLIDAPNISAEPPLVITPLQDEPVLSATYRGQDFVWRQNPAWETARPKDSTDLPRALGVLFRWIALRQMPPNDEGIILWARSDLFLDASTSAPGT